MTKLTYLSVVVLVALVTNGYCQNGDDDALRFERNPRLTMQGCLLRCLDKDLCCSCKESGKLSMNAAMINDLGKTCAASDVFTCSMEWVDSWMNAERSGASNCTVQSKVETEINQCISKCNGRPWSNPLNLDTPLRYPGQLPEFSDLASYNEPDFTDFCNDMRDGGILCTVNRKDSFTAGNTRCRSENRCGYHDKKYSWCYVDHSNHWDYCCTGACGFEQNTKYMWCKSGNQWQYCGNAGKTDIQGRQCASDYPCGMHQENGKASYYWCYVDLNKNWDRCCEPWDPCTSKGWCYTGNTKESGKKFCKK